jgi:hypothetical protein
LSLVCLSLKGDIEYRLEKEEETFLNGKWENLLAIGIGASIGTISRYYLSVVTLDTGYPIGTIIVNLIGSLLLGFLTAWFIIFVPKERMKLGLGVGLIIHYWIRAKAKNRKKAPYQDSKLEQRRLQRLCSIHIMVYYTENPSKTVNRKYPPLVLPLVLTRTLTFPFSK